MTKSQCQVCGAEFRGIPLNTVREGKQVEACPSCYKRLDEVYRKNSCLACVFFRSGNCELFSTELEEPYVNSATCSFFTTDTKPEAVAKARIKKLEMSGRFEEVAKEYAKLGEKDKATEAEEKARNKPVPNYSLEELLSQLDEHGQTLTYYCVHCGESLKVGAKQEPQTSCPHCKYDLSAIDLKKLINQHI
jgi:NAD-dependent SIR2 family protein deacetylase